ncbi:cation:proton antiporter domain-containing protein [Mycolicibacterium phlei]
MVRLVPVLLALLGSSLPWAERLLVGWLGPRGTSSIVFGLLAFNELAGRDEADVLMVMVIVVLGSVVLHGATAPAAARAFGRAQPRLSA